MGAGADRLDDGLQLHGPERAVDPEGRDAQPLERHHHGIDPRAEEGAPSLLEAHGREHGQGAVVLHGQERRLELVEVGEGLQKHGVAALGAGPDLFGDRLVDVLERGIPQGSQHLAAGPDIQGHPGPEGVRCGTGDPHGGGYRLRDGVSGALQLPAVGPKRIGRDEIGPGLQVVPVDGADQVRMGEVQDLGQLPEPEPARLKHRPHAPVEEQDVLSKPLSPSILHSFPLSFDTDSPARPNSGSSPGCGPRSGPRSR